MTGAYSDDGVRIIGRANSEQQHRPFLWGWRQPLWGPCKIDCPNQATLVAALTGPCITALYLQRRKVDGKAELCKGVPGTHKIETSAYSLQWNGT